MKVIKNPLKTKNKETPRCPLLVIFAKIEKNVESLKFPQCSLPKENAWKTKTMNAPTNLKPLRLEKK